MNKLLIIASIFFATVSADGVDPVCKMKVKATETRTSTFEKVKYTFCSESCKKNFDANPKKYVKK